jgi:hypothetical protein
MQIVYSWTLFHTQSLLQTSFSSSARKSLAEIHRLISERFKYHTSFEMNGERGAESIWRWFRRMLVVSQSVSIELRLYIILCTWIIYVWNFRSQHRATLHDFITQHKVVWERRAETKRYEWRTLAVPSVPFKEIECGWREFNMHWPRSL